MGSLAQPKISQLLKEFYDREKLDLEVLSKPINFYPLGLISIPFYNSPARQRIMPRHDFNHLLTGYDSSVSGEAQLAAWEIASGFPSPYKAGYIYSTAAMLPGFVLCPIKVINAFIKGWKTKNVYHLDMSEEEIISLDLETFKQEIKKISSRVCTHLPRPYEQLEIKALRGARRSNSTSYCDDE